MRKSQIHGFVVVSSAKTFKNYRVKDIKNNWRALILNRVLLHNLFQGADVDCGFRLYNFIFLGVLCIDGGHLVLSVCTVLIS